MSSSRRLALAAATLVTTAVTALAPTAAHAAAIESADSRGDVVAQSGVKPGTVDPGRRNGDVTSVRVAHGPRNVVLRLHFAALRQKGSWHRHWFRLVTDEGVRRELAVTAKQVGS